MRKLSTRSLVLIPEFAIILALLSQITIPIGPVPITLQTFGIMLLASTLSPLQSIMSVFLYLCLGFIGLPVFAGGGAGVATFFHPLTGFLLAFIPAAAFLSFWVRKSGHPEKLNLVAHLVTAILILTIGTVWLKYFSHLSWSAALWAAFIPFIIPEILKSFAAAYIALKLRHALRIVPKGA